jgi:hypothetical protein
MAAAPTEAPAASTVTVRCKEFHGGSDKYDVYIDVVREPLGAVFVSVTGGSNVNSSLSTVSATQMLLTIRYRNPPNVTVAFSTGTSVTIPGATLAAAPDCSTLTLSAVPTGPIGVAALGVTGLAAIGILTSRSAHTRRSETQG